jgi:hypothetical protein
MKRVDLKFHFGECSNHEVGNCPDLALTVWVSPTQSDLVKPNPATPPPPEKEIGKETVKFLATSDHVMQQMESLPLFPVAQTRCRRMCPVRVGPDLD